MMMLKTLLKKSTAASSQATQVFLGSHSANLSYRLPARLFTTQPPAPEDPAAHTEKVADNATATQTPPSRGDNQKPRSGKGAFQQRDQKRAAAGGATASGTQHSSSGVAIKGSSLFSKRRDNTSAGAADGESGQVDPDYSGESGSRGGSSSYYREQTEQAGDSYRD